MIETGQVKSVHTTGRKQPKRELTALLVTLLLVMISVEYLARAMHDRRMATLRVEQGVRNAILIAHSPDSRQVLFAGNSLVFDDLSEAQLQRGLNPGFVVHAAGVPGSTYDDWQVGLPALFARGSQPDIVVFSISPSQFIRPSETTPLPVSMLWRLRDIFAYRHDRSLDLTQFTELFLEHYSTFYSLRNTVRIYVRKFIPGYEALVYTWTGSHAGPVTPRPAAETIDAERLAKLAAECRPRRQFILLISPTNQVEDQQLESALKAAAEGLGIAVIEPISERQWPLTKFREDHYHLTPDAADEFSALVAADLRQKLADVNQLASGQ